MSKTKAVTKWSDDLYVTISDFAKSGMTDAEIARAVGTTPVTMKRWRKDNPALDRIMIKARDGYKMRNSNSQPTFLQYVEDRLPDNLRDAWNAIIHIDSDPNGIRRVEKHMAKLGTHAKQHLFVHALVKCNFIAASACRVTCTPWQTYMSWKDSDPDFANVFSYIHEMKKDFFDSCLIEGCRNGEPSAYIFANRTFNQDRYPNPKTELAGKVDVGGEVTHEHIHKIEELDLPIEAMQAILDKMKEKSVTVIDVPMIEQ